MPATEALATARATIAARKLEDETRAVERLLEDGGLSAGQRDRALARARELVRTARDRRADRSPLDAFLEEYGLANEEGVALMCLAEALLRIPDAETVDALIADKIPSGQWAAHLGRSDMFMVNASTWALMFTGRVLDPLTIGNADSPQHWLKRLVARLGEPVIRESIKAAMRILGREFVLGENIEQALQRGRNEYRERALFSFDMLGEGARTHAMARRYHRQYTEAIRTVSQAQSGKQPSKQSQPDDNLRSRDGISVKISALHPHFDRAHFAARSDEIHAALKSLALEAKAGDIGLNIDAEEADRLEITIDLFERLALDPQLAGFRGLGFVVQAYGKRATATIDYLVHLARAADRPLMVRLVKGAYWDAEIKHAQSQGLDGLPVFTRKASTDLSYLVCARHLLDAAPHLYPQFATHNAHTVAAVMECAGSRRDFEFQRLHGMGALLYDICNDTWQDFPPVRTYAPVGLHEDLLAYLVRRLLENGANSSFVNRFLDQRHAVEIVVTDPVASVRSSDSIPHPDIPVPADIFLPRRAAAALDLADQQTLATLQQHFRHFAEQPLEAATISAGQTPSAARRTILDPGDHRRCIGHVSETPPQQIEQALACARAAQPDWNARGGAARAEILERIADRFEANLHHLMYILVREAGKTIADALAEVREAVDFCRYYAEQARQRFTSPLELPGPSGEHNRLHLEGRGVFLCISPWNFPLAIFCGQITGALAAGNTVIAKPAEQTPLVAAEATRLMQQAGLPTDVLHLLPGDGPTLGAALLRHPHIGGVAFTGSADTARSIYRILAERDGPLIPLIAETGGLNAMFADSSALLETMTDDVIRSAFGSAGQRCSALRVLYLQDDIHDKALDLICGAMAALHIGDPADPATDVGPVIDETAQAMLQAHIRDMQDRGFVCHGNPLPSACNHGTFVAPTIIEINRLADLDGEKFGPVLHIRRYAEAELDACLQEVADSGYGLTLGIHSRIDGRARAIAERLPVGNAYINRNMTGAVVGSQPFGGRGLSGTGPKAGGPNYLTAFACERTVTTNIAATGGNPELLRLSR